MLIRIYLYTSDQHFSFYMKNFWANSVCTTGDSEMVKTRSASGGVKRRASLDPDEELSPLVAEAVRRVSPFVSITPTPPPGPRNGGGGPPSRKRILLEDRLEVRPMHVLDPAVPSTSRGLSSANSPASSSRLMVGISSSSTGSSPTKASPLYSDSEDEELALMEQRLMAEGHLEDIEMSEADEDETIEEVIDDHLVPSSVAASVGVDGQREEPVGERVAYIHVSEGCEEDLEAQLKGAKNLDIQILEEESLPDIDESDMIHGLDHTGTSRDYVDDRHRCTIQCPVGCQGHLRPNEIVIYESFKWNGRLRGRRRYSIYYYFFVLLLV